MALIEIEEDRNEQQFGEGYWQLMSDKQRKRGEYYATLYSIRRAEVDTKYKQEWEDIQKLYQCDRDAVPDDPDFPNNRIPILLPTIEGQVASMSEARTEFRHISNNPAQREYMNKFDAASEYYRRKAKFQLHFKDFSRSYEVFGNAWVSVGWESGFGKKKTSLPKGHPRISTCELGSILVDGAIKDVKDLQYARYIIQEIGHVPIMWARTEYGDEYADALLAGYNGTSEGDEDPKYDDASTFMLLNVWTRDNPQKNLQLIEMDMNGLILRESDPSEPYYKNVDNEYPFGIARMMPIFGEFYGFGDGKVLKPIQESLNNLMDEWELAARFSAQAHFFVDPDSRMAEGQITSNPADVIFVKDPKNNILPVQSQGINPVVPQMIAALYEFAQKATRFHDTMTGNQSGVSATATQINTQINQGSVGIRDKKTDIASVMEWADAYALKLCLEKWDKPFWAGMGDELSEYIEPENLEQLPSAVPVTGSAIEEAVATLRDTGKKDMPKYFEVPADEKGKPIMTDIDFYTKVIIGEAMPKDSTSMYNILLGLSQIQILNNETQQVEPLITPARMRQALEDILGMKLKTREEQISEVKENFVQATQQQLNPVGQNNVVQTPQAQGGMAPNLAQTVPQMPQGDSRRVQL